MNPKWAEENLQTIRTLMERSALYRRALAPVMLVCGIAGLVGGLIGWRWHLNSSQSFVIVWISTALFALTCSLLLIRKQALKESEPFWSAPTRRIAQALMPSFLVGMVVTVACISYQIERTWRDPAVILIWCFAYGCGIHSAGFFMPRGIRWFGWLFLIAGFALLGGIFFRADWLAGLESLHPLMAAIFGGLHLAYGIYLYFTEKKNAA